MLLAGRNFRTRTHKSDSGRNRHPLFMLDTKRDSSCFPSFLGSKFQVETSSATNKGLSLYWRVRCFIIYNAMLEVRFVGTKYRLLVQVVQGVFGSNRSELSSSSKLSNTNSASNKFVSITRERKSPNCIWWKWHTRVAKNVSIYDASFLECNRNEIFLLQTC